MAVEKMPDLLWPPKEKYGLRDYEKVFQTSEAHDIFEQRGINRFSGCMESYPDQHIANILPLDAHEELNLFFDQFVLR